MSELNGNSKIIAGGTDILVNMKKGLLSPRYLVSIAKIAGMSEIEPGNGAISIGAHLIVAKLTEFDIIRTKLPSLAKAASVLGSPLVRNRATIGGNIVTARPAADLPPPLLAMGAKVKLESKKGAREVALDDFFLGPGATVMKPDEILSRIIVNEMPPFTGNDYIKLGHRRALEIAIVAVASRITLDAPNGTIKEARVILSSVAPKAIHAVSAEKALIGEKPTEALVKKAAQLAGTDCSPITDIRGGAGYRCAMVEVLTKRTLLAAIQEARGK
jgi:carbon-monoxide dehydrogenase medium subunit